MWAVTSRISSRPSAWISGTLRDFRACSTSSSIRASASASAVGALRNSRGDVPDLAGDDLLPDLVDRGHVLLRHVGADLAEADAVLRQAEDRVPAAAELAVLHVLDREEDGLVDPLRGARQDVRPEVRLVGVDADPPDVLLLRGV